MRILIPLLLLLSNAALAAEEAKTLEAETPDSPSSGVQIICRESLPKLNQQALVLKLVHQINHFEIKEGFTTEKGEDVWSDFARIRLSNPSRSADGKYYIYSYGYFYENGTGPGCSPHSLWTDMTYPTRVETTENKWLFLNTADYHASEVAEFAREKYLGGLSGLNPKLRADNTYESRRKVDCQVTAIAN